MQSLDLNPKLSLMDVCTVWAVTWSRRNHAVTHSAISQAVCKGAMSHSVLWNSTGTILSGTILLWNQPISKMLSHDHIVCTRWLMLSTSISGSVETLIKPQPNGPHQKEHHLSPQRRRGGCCGIGKYNRRPGAIWSVGCRSRSHPQFWAEIICSSLFSWICH